MDILLTFTEYYLFCFKGFSHLTWKCNNINNNSKRKLAPMFSAMTKGLCTPGTTIHATKKQRFVSSCLSIFFPRRSLDHMHKRGEIGGAWAQKAVLNVDAKEKDPGRKWMSSQRSSYYREMSGSVLLTIRSVVSWIRPVAKSQWLLL